MPDLPTNILIAEPASVYQLRLPIETLLESSIPQESLDIEGTLSQLLQTDLTFKGQKTNSATHNIHSFAAKFPPQLPRLFIQKLSRPGETVLDPMNGSGTTLVEALLTGRNGIGVDLDPLAALLAKVKTTSANLAHYHKTAITVLCQARSQCAAESVTDEILSRDYSPETVQFFRYWYEDHTVNELYPLAKAIKAVPDSALRAFLQLVFSSVIITKSGGVTRARDLAHSRPHRDLNKRIERNALDLFEERLETVLEALTTVAEAPGRTQIVRADARRLPLADGSVHLIVTSPPYAANAIDYMRAHKFSLMWFGYTPANLSRLRGRYIGAELRSPTLEIPSQTATHVLQELYRKDERRAAVVAYYYRDLEASLREILRVTAVGRAAILVVGSSILCGVGIKVPAVTAELAVSVGFRLAGVAHREIVRDARMMPVSQKTERSGIEARMHEEGVIGLIKPGLTHRRASRSSPSRETNRSSFPHPALPLPA